MKTPTKRQEAEARTAKVASKSRKPDHTDVLKTVDLVVANPGLRHYTADQLNGFAGEVFKSYQAIKAMEEHQRGFTPNMRN